MDKEMLLLKITKDLKRLRLPVDEVDLYIRPYSKTYYGRYFPTKCDEVKPKIYLYPYDVNNKVDYDQTLDTAIHEMVHHLQYNSPYFVRLKHVMHNTNFWKLYNRYHAKAVDLGIIGGMLNENKKAI